MARPKKSTLSKDSSAHLGFEAQLLTTHCLTIMNLALRDIKADYMPYFQEFEL